MISGLELSKIFSKLPPFFEEIMNEFFHPPVFIDQERQYTAGMLFTVLWTVILAVTTMEIVDILITPAYIYRWMLIVIVVDVLSFVLLFINQLGYTQFSAYVLTITLWILITGLVISGGGLNDASTPAFFIIIALSGIVLGRKAILVTFIGFVITSLGIMLIKNSPLQMGQISYNSYSVFSSYIFYALIIAAVQYLNVGAIKNANQLVHSEAEVREKTEHALKITLDFTNNLIEMVNVMVIGFDIKGNLTIFNKAAETITGYTPTEVIDQNKMASIIPCGQEKNFQPYDSSAYPQNFECTIQTKTGEEKYITWQNSKIYNQYQQPEFLYFGMDITEQKQHERSLEMITSVSSALRTVKTRLDIYKVVLDQLCDLFKTNCVGLVTLDPDNDQYHFEVKNDDIFQVFLNQIFSKEEDLKFLTIDDTYLNNDIQNSLKFQSYHQLQTMSALACISLIVRGNKLGYLIIAREKMISKEEMNSIKAIADITANAAYRLNLFEQTKRDVQRLAALHQIDLALSANFDIHYILETVLDQAVNHLNTDAADILLLDADSNQLKFVAGKGLEINEINNRDVEVGKSLAGTAVFIKSIIYIADLSVSENLSEIQKHLCVGNNVSYYAVPLLAKNTVRGVLEVYLNRQLAPNIDWLEFLQMIAGQAAIAIDDAELFQDLQDSNLELANAYEATIEGWSHALDLRDKETEGHTQRVTELTLKLARIMGFNETELAHIRRGALLHDIGKMGIPDNILLKPGPLTDEERKIICNHPQFALEMLSPIKFLHKALDIPFCHHEKWDGSGYPQHLKGEEIPLAARIFAVVDVWDAVTSDRPYRAAWHPKKAMDYILSESGIHFDPQVVKYFVGMMTFIP